MQASATPERGDLHRKLKSRHLSMIAIGGSIGTGLFVAHYLAMSAISRAGTVPGRGQLGIVASKSVGPASISYDNSAISAQVDAGHWALTSYGLMYWELMRMVGTGGWQL